MDQPVANLCMNGVWPQLMDIFSLLLYHQGILSCNTAAGGGLLPVPTYTESFPLGSKRDVATLTSLHLDL